MHRSRISLGIALLAPLASLGAQRPARPAPRPRPTHIYVRPGFAASTGAGTRGASHVGPLCLLAPLDHAAETASATPTLYWRLAPVVRDTGLVAHVRVRGIDTTLRVPPSTPGAPRAQRLSLGALGISLAPGDSLRWRVVIASPSGASWRASATLRRAARASLPDDSPTVAAARTLAGAGLWYDALDAVSRGAERGEAGAESLRARLLGEVGVPAACGGAPNR